MNRRWARMDADQKEELFYFSDPRPSAPICGPIGFSQGPTMRLSTALLAVLLLGPPARAADPPGLDTLLRTGGFQYRNLGPFRCGSWVSDVAVPETPAKAHLYT